MKKIKMWYIKLAFAALFFTLIVQFLAPQAKANSTQIALAQGVPDQRQIDSAKLTTAIKEVKLKEPNAILVKGKPYAYALTIPKLNVYAGILGLGLTNEGKMAVPDNYTEVGWYSLGAHPGTRGSAVLGAHVDNGGKIPGVFKNLKKLKVGDSIYVTKPNGDVLHYKVAERKVYDYKTKITDTVFAKNDKERLNLITCYGTWLPKENTYNQRLVVFAELNETHVASR